jgi:hypothetical protein
MEDVEQWRRSTSGIYGRPGGYKEPNGLDVVPEGGRLNGV